jgi:hypothetical protein
MRLKYDFDPERGQTLSQPGTRQSSLAVPLLVAF